MNTLYYGDNLKILREYIKDESVDLIYLDPPFNSNRNCNVLFRNESGNGSDADHGVRRHVALEPRRRSTDYSPQRHREHRERPIKKSQ